MMYDFQAAPAAKDVERELAVYRKLLAKYDALITAADEGVFQVTIHSDSGAITIPIGFIRGRGMAIELAEVLADWILKIEANLNHSLENMGEEVTAERKQEEARQQQRDQEAAAARAKDAQSELANSRNPQ